MTPPTAYNRNPGFQRLPSLDNDQTRVLGLLSRLAWPSGRVEIDIDLLAALSELRPLSLRLALLSLKLSRKIALYRRRNRKRRIVVTVFGGRYHLTDG